MKRQQLAPEIVEMYETPLTLEQFERRMAARPTEEEVAELMSLVRWFTGRYPTAKDRFAYIKRKYAEWTRNPPVRIEPAAQRDGVFAEEEGSRRGPPGDR